MLSVSGIDSGATSHPTVSVDAVSDASNTATSVGTIDPCASVSSGATFISDVVIQSVTSLSGMEAHLLYDPAILRVATVDYNFLLGTTGASVLDLGDPVPDSDGDFEMGAVTFPLSAATGSGVLVRVTLEAVGDGISPLDLVDVKLADALGDPIQPADSTTGVYQGPVNDATIAVGGPCSDSDGDDFTDEDESAIGTDPADNCGAHTTTTPIFSQAWPADVYSASGSIPETTDKVTLQDLTSFLAPVRRLDSSPGDAEFHVRWDLVPGEGVFADTINLQDLTRVITTNPPMFGGERAFGYPDPCNP